MNAYELVLRVADELNLSPNEALNGRQMGKRKLLRYINEGEIKSIARVRQPRIVATVPSVSGTSVYSMGNATYTGEPELPYSTWRGSSPRPPVNNEQITYVRVMNASGKYGQPLEFQTIEGLLEMGFDLSNPPTSTPQYYFLWHNSSENSVPLQLGLYPAPNYTANDGIQLCYVPTPSNMRWLWGTGIDTNTQKVTVAYGSKAVSIYGTPSSTNCFEDGLVDGLHFGVVHYFGEYPYHWYTIDLPTRIAANADYFLDGNYATGRYIKFDLDQVYQEQLDPATGVNFVVASPSTLGKIYPAMAELPAIYAAAILMSQKQDKRSLELKAQWEGMIREFRANQHRGHDFTGR